ncbi:MAG: hypothetical protein IAE94_10830 [Chthoniobacterales bacterium]|nr:hypothetical protein [Chthoniobacterales bacterium]
MSLVMKASRLEFGFLAILLLSMSDLLAQAPVPQGLQDGDMEAWSTYVLSQSDWLNPDVVDGSIPSSWRVMQYPANGQVVDQPRAVIARDDSEKHGGGSSLRIESGNNAALLVQRFNLDPSADYVLRFWAKGENLPENAVPVKIWLKKGSEVATGGDFYDSATTTELKGDPISGSFDWKPFEIPFRVETDSGIELRVEVSGPEAKFWIDDVVVERAKP